MAKQDNQPVYGPSLPTLPSLNGYHFTFKEEVGKDPKTQEISLHPHIPPGSSSSGVTLGPGYDMKERSPEEVRATLIGIGMSEERASAFSEGAGLEGKEAREWASDHRQLNITPAERIELFNVLIPQYEERAQTALNNFAQKNGLDPEDVKLANLDDRQRGALVDIEYNGGIRNFPMLTDAVIHNNWGAAAAEYTRVDGNGAPLGRNENYFNEFIYPGMRENYEQEQTLAKLGIQELDISKELPSESVTHDGLPHVDPHAVRADFDNHYGESLKDLYFGSQTNPDQFIIDNQSFQLNENNVPHTPDTLQNEILGQNQSSTYLDSQIPEHASHSPNYTNLTTLIENTSTEITTPAPTEPQYADLTGNGFQPTEPQYADLTGNGFQPTEPQYADLTGNGFQPT
ncbi:hypothetical protein, partial [Fibrella aquatilis]